MAIFVALVVFAIGYGTILVQNFPYRAPQFIVNMIYALGLGSLISLLVFTGLGAVYRWKLDHRREECRQLVARLLESRLGKPATAPIRDNRSGQEDARRVRDLVEPTQASLTGGFEPGSTP
jgi:hypothetical protein